MIPFLLLLGHFTSSGPGGPAGTTPASEPGAFVCAAAKPSTGSGLAPSAPANPDPDGGILMLDEATSRLLNDAGKVSAHLRRLLDEGKYAEAYAEARKTREERPELPAWTAEAYADCAIMVGRYREAYDDMARLLQNPGYHNENRYLRLSIASAAMGRVVDGQMEYARYWLENAYQYRPGKSSGLPRHIPPSARKVMLVSTLALAAKAPNGGTYYELCLRIDPKCTLAADEAILYYTHKHRDADAKRVAEGMVKALPAGPDRDRFLRHLESAGKRR